MVWQRKVVSVAVSSAVITLLLSGIAYMLHGIFEAAPVAWRPAVVAGEEVGAQQKIAQAARRARAEERLAPAEIPWGRSLQKPEPVLLYPPAQVPWVVPVYRPRASVSFASVPSLPVKRDVANPDPAKVHEAEIPWKPRPATGPSGAEVVVREAAVPWKPQVTKVHAVTTQPVKVHTASTRAASTRPGGQ